MSHKTYGIDHICINTLELDKVKEFYIKYFDFECTLDFRGPEHSMIMLYNGPFCIELYDDPAVNDTPGPVDHICFLVSGLHEMKDELEKEGYAIDWYPGDKYNADGILLYSMCFVTGPVGEKIELYEKVRPDLYEKSKK